MEKDAEKRKADELAQEQNRRDQEEEKRRENRERELEMLKRADARAQNRNSRPGASPTRKKPTNEELKRK